MEFGDIVKFPVRLWPASTWLNVQSGRLSESTSLSVQGDEKEKECVLRERILEHIKFPKQKTENIYWKIPSLDLARLDLARLWGGYHACPFPLPLVPPSILHLTQTHAVNNGVCTSLADHSAVQKPWKCACVLLFCWYLKYLLLLLCRTQRMRVCWCHIEGSGWLALSLDQAGVRQTLSLVE